MTISTTDVEGTCFRERGERSQQPAFGGRGHLVSHKIALDPGRYAVKWLIKLGGNLNNGFGASQVEKDISNGMYHPTTRRVELPAGTGVLLFTNGY